MLFEAIAIITALSAAYGVASGEEQKRDIRKQARASKAEVRRQQRIQAAQAYRANRYREAQILAAGAGQFGGSIQAGSIVGGRSALEQQMVTLSGDTEAQIAAINMSARGTQKQITSNQIRGVVGAASSLMGTYSAPDTSGATVTTPPLYDTSWETKSGYPIS